MISQKHLEIVKACQKIYEKDLLDKQLLVIYIDRITKKQKYVFINFGKENFLHLTGIVFKNENSSGAKHFYDLLLNGRLDINDCFYKLDGTTELKMDILPHIMNITNTAKMIGTYNNNKLNLVADKIIGSIFSCVALVKDKNIYYPCSALKEDVRSQVEQNNQIRAIYVRKYLTGEKGAVEKSCFELKSHAKNFFESELSDEIFKIIKTVQ